MAHDHYVPVTYLRRFTDPSRHFLHIYDKETGNYRCQKPRKVCRERDGDINPYFKDPAILRELLGLLEPEWGNAVDAMIEDPWNLNARYTISGMMSYMMSWVPAMRRTSTNMMEHQMGAMRPWMAQEAAHVIDDDKDAKEMAEALLDRNIKIEVDPHFPKALALTRMVSNAEALFQGKWMLLQMPLGQPFITSDTPVIKHYFGANDLIGKSYFPLTPDHAVFVLPDTNQERNPEALIAGEMKSGVMPDSLFATLTEVMIKSAERVVISSQQDEQISNLVLRYKDWRLETQIDTIPAGNEQYTVFRVSPRQRS